MTSSDLMDIRTPATGVDIRCFSANEQSLFDHSLPDESTCYIYYLLETKGSSGQQMTLANQKYSGTCADLFFIPGLSLSDWEQRRSYCADRIIIAFNQELVQYEHHEWIALLFHSSISHIHVAGNEALFVHTVLSKLLTEINERATGFQPYVRLLLGELLRFSARCVANEAEAKPAVQTHPAKRKVAEIASYIERHFQSPLSLSELSELFFISPYYLSRMFKETMGTNFIDYVHIRRIQEAQKLLTATDKKIIEIAESTGFESVVHFGRVFKKLVGCTPLDYRRLNRI